jgi:phosphoglycolate phosphatase
MNLFFDLDGTLIDSRLRLYLLFQYLVKCSELDFDQYWELKRNKINHKKILTSKFNYSDEEYIDFENKWMAEIELKKWLDLDVSFDGVYGLLARLSENNSIYVVTARHNSENTLKQLKSFKWKTFIKSILITEQKHSKIDLIKNNVIVKSEDWFIGDTGKDIETGKVLGINTAAVLSGFLNKNCLIEYNPDIIIENVTKFELI